MKRSFAITVYERRVAGSLTWQPVVPAVAVAPLTGKSEVRLREALGKAMAEVVRTIEPDHAELIDPAAPAFAAQAERYALRLAELHVLEARTRAVPVLLLDDVSSELDRERTARLFKLVGALGAQVFVTTTDPAIAALLPDARRFMVTDGTVSAGDR